MDRKIFASSPRREVAFVGRPPLERRAGDAEVPRHKNHNYGLDHTQSRFHGPGNFADAVELIKNWVLRFD